MYKNKYKKSAWEWFSRFIRLRDTESDGLAQCITCWTKKHPKDGDAGHFISRRHNATLFMEINVAFQCKRCNNPRWGNTHPAFREALIDMYGEEIVRDIEKEALTPKKFTDTEFIAIAQMYEKQVEELLKEKGIDKWW